MLDFEGWFENFTEKVRSSGYYTGDIDEDSVRIYYESGIPYDEAARDFVEQMDTF